MKTLSVCMIVKNEEKVLKRCLESIKNIADEIIIVDTGSTDNTKSIALEYTEKIYDYKWIDNFSDARNFSFSKASSDYIMWVDADDIIEEKTQDKIKGFCSNSDFDVLMLPYHVAFDEDGEVTLMYYRERVVKRSKNFKWKEYVHEYIDISDSLNTMYLNLPIIHGEKERNHSNRNLDIYKNMEKNNIEFSTRALYYYARELKFHNMFKESSEKFMEFLNKEDAWIEDKINACMDLSDCYSKHEDKLEFLFLSFIYDLPRPEVCCRIGKIYFDLQDYDKAIYWYKSALIAPKSDMHGFVNKQYWEFIPHIQLCVCYDRIGNREKAIDHNNFAGRHYPNHKSFIFNKKYFEEE